MTYDLDAHRASLQGLRGQSGAPQSPPASPPPPPPPPPPDGNSASPTSDQVQYGPDSHRASLQAMRGQAFPGAPYAAPEPPPADVRTAEQKAFDATHGAPERGGYDLNTQALIAENGEPVPVDQQLAFRGEAEGALKALGFHRTTGNTFIAECLDAGRQYQALTPEQRTAWTAKQNDMLDRMPNGAELKAAATKAFAELQKTAPKLAVRLSTNGGGMSFQAVVQLALQQQRLDYRATLAGAKP